MTNSTTNTDITIDTGAIPQNRLNLDGTPYKCKGCGEEGRMHTSSNRPQCPNCGRFMEFVDELPGEDDGAEEE